MLSPSTQTCPFGTYDNTNTSYNKAQSITKSFKNKIQILKEQSLSDEW